MTWLYVPGTSSPSAPASAGLSSGSCSLSTAAPRLVEGSVTWRGKLQLLPAWSRRWRAGGFIQLLSGLTCSPSTLDAGVDAFISSLRETPVRRTASPESGKGSEEQGSSLQRSAASPMSAGLILSSARTCRGTQTGSLKPSSRHWSDWATSLRQEYSARPRPETPCGASDCSSWPSASVMDTAEGSDLAKVDARRAKHKARGINGNGFGESLSEKAQKWPGPETLDSTNTRNSTAKRSNPNSTHSIGNTLCDAVTLWMGPNVPNGGRTANHAEQIGGTLYHEGKKVQLGLEHQAKDFDATMWRAPGTGSDNSLRGSAQDPAERKAGGHQVNLQDQAAFFRPPSSPDPRIAGGPMSSTDGPNSNQPSVKRKLNPIFVEALMRWPTGLSGFERQETAWIRWWLLMPSFVLTLCSQKDEAQGSLF